MNSPNIAAIVIDAVAQTTSFEVNNDIKFNHHIDGHRYLLKAEDISTASHRIPSVAVVPLR